MPAFAYPRRADQAQGRLAHRASAAPAVTAGDGDSSISFWCRRWTLHSRSPRCTTVPWASREDLDLDVARALEVPLEQQPVVAERRPRPRACAASSASSSSAGSRTTRIPRPPPPALALTSSG